MRQPHASRSPGSCRRARQPPPTRHRGGRRTTGDPDFPCADSSPRRGEGASPARGTQSPGGKRQATADRRARAGRKRSAARMRSRRAAEVKFHKLWRHHTSHDDAVATAIAQVPHAREDGDTRAVVQLDADQLKQLSAVFAAPRWLRDLGVASWLLVGVAALLVGVTWILGVTSTIVIPVLVGLVIATVGSPAVSWLHGHRWPCALGALVVLLFVIAVAAVIAILVLGGVRAQSDAISTQASAALDKFDQWLKDLGVNQTGATTASNDVKTSVPDVTRVFTKGLAAGISGLTSLGFFLAFSAFSTFMLLK